MTNADRLQRWNHWYESTPERWRFQLVVWTLVAIGAVNMLLTIAVGFPFALLVGIAIAAMAAVRVPYALGWLQGSGGDAARMEIEAPSWVLQANRWYDGLDETQRPFVILAALAIPGAINMLLTFASGFPFGLLFLLAVLGVIAIRAPYAAGWFKDSPAGPALTVEPAAPRLGDESARSSFAASPQSPPATASEPARRTNKPRATADAASSEI